MGATRADYDRVVYGDAPTIPDCHARPTSAGRAVCNLTGMCHHSASRPTPRKSARALPRRSDMCGIVGKFVHDASASVWDAIDCARTGPW